MGTGAMQLGYDIRNSVPDAGNFREPLLRDQAFKRYGERCEAIGSPRVSLLSIWIVAAQCAPLRVFPQELGDHLRIDLGHSNSSPRLGSARLSLPPETLEAHFAASSGL